MQSGPLFAIRWIQFLSLAIFIYNYSIFGHVFFFFPSTREYHFSFCFFIFIICVLFAVVFEQEKCNKFSENVIDIDYKQWSRSSSDEGKNKRTICIIKCFKKNRVDFTIIITLKFYRYKSGIKSKNKKKKEKNWKHNIHIHIWRKKMCELLCSTCNTIYWNNEQKYQCSRKRNRRKKNIEVYTYWYCVVVLWLLCVCVCWKWWKSNNTEHTEESLNVFFFATKNPALRQN